MQVHTHDLAIRGLLLIHLGLPRRAVVNTSRVRRGDHREQRRRSFITSRRSWESGSRLGAGGSGMWLFEESMPRCESTALETESFPECPPGPVATLASRLVWSASMRAKMTFEQSAFQD